MWQTNYLAMWQTNCVAMWQTNCLAMWQTNCLAMWQTNLPTVMFVVDVDLSLTIKFNCWFQLCGTTNFNMIPVQYGCLEASERMSFSSNAEVSLSVFYKQSTMNHSSRYHDLAQLFRLNKYSVCLSSDSQPINLSF
jgi:hypothetical protein